MIDLNRHGIIEAHAGTGKTHTIVQMVLRMLCGDGCEKTDLRQILLVTYTEKAAGELRRRIREELEKRVAGINTGLQQHLQDCLNNMHEALIGTIHSVCLRLLRSYPLETGIPYQLSQVDDNEAVETVLRESLRTDWQDATTCIPWALEQCRAMGESLQEKHLRCIRAVAVAALDPNAVVDRRMAGSNLSTLRADLKKNRSEFGQYRNILNHAIEQFIESCNALTKTGKLDDERVALVNEQSEELRAMISTGNYDVKICANPCKKGSAAIFTKALAKKIPQCASVTEAAEAIKTHPGLALLSKEQELHTKIISTLLCDAAEYLRDRWRRTKMRDALISFQDMLVCMHNALERNSALRDILRSRLRYGIIDEFQDTSLLQWQIFENLFLKDGNSENPREPREPRLFIVGDPKQSIYSFQGADVRTYLQARQTVLVESKLEKPYPLLTNYRSLPGIIEGYNKILTSDNAGNGWFRIKDLPYSGDARAPDRGLGEHPLGPAPIQVVPVSGNAGRRTREMAATAAEAIKKLHGRMVSLPDGDQWKSRRLEYGDFAVLVERHRQAVPFIDKFQEEGIPCAKYKMEGVFQSAMARHFRAVLQAIDEHSGDPAPRLAALLTCFFGKHPAEIDPDRDLEPGQGAPGIADCLEQWVPLTQHRQWARLFRSICTITRVRDRLERMADGERLLADLGQVMDYALEFLIRGNTTLGACIGQLLSLYKEDVSAGEDKNIHALATAKPKVQILTMHAAKGLEFPIVFIMTGGSEKSSKGPGYLRWIDPADSRLHLTPAVSFNRDVKRQFPESDSQTHEERMRLLYVALTRPKLMAFLPMHLAEGEKTGTWAERTLPSSPDNDLTPVLQKLLDDAERDSDLRKLISRCGIDCMAGWPADPAPDNASAQKMTLVDNLSEIPLDNVSGADEEAVPAFTIARQTSYTELSRAMENDRSTDRSEETEVPDAEIKPHGGVLPGGRKTGDALHRALEELLRVEEINPVIINDRAVHGIVRPYLEDNGILQSLSDENMAVAAAVDMIRGALRFQYVLPAGSPVKIADLKKSCRVPELEFQLGVEHDWIHGFMDLVFRVENPGARHPWHYFVLDWKSDFLEAYDHDRIGTCIRERHYDLQAKIYCHALDKFLLGLLGKEYDPEKNLGGAVYVFLRSFENTPHNGLSHAWYYVPKPEEDAAFVRSRLHETPQNY